MQRLEFYCLLNNAKLKTVEGKIYPHDLSAILVSHQDPASFCVPIFWLPNATLFLEASIWVVPLPCCAWERLVPWCSSITNGLSWSAIASQPPVLWMTKNRFYESFVHVKERRNTHIWCLRHKLGSKIVQIYLLISMRVDEGSASYVFKSKKEMSQLSA